MSRKKNNIKPVVKLIPDWWDNISEAERASIERGLEDARQGRVTPNEEVMKKYKKWL